MDKQEFLNKMIEFLVDQGGPAVSSSVMQDCVYRDEDKGRQCGIGSFISEADYNPKMEGEIASNVLMRYLPKDHVLHTLNDENFLDDAQDIHDRAHATHSRKRSPRPWKDALKMHTDEFCSKYGLTTPAVLKEA